jgi:hypothetical protein
VYVPKKSGAHSLSVASKGVRIESSTECCSLNRVQLIHYCDVVDPSSLLQLLVDLA